MKKDPAQQKPITNVSTIDCKFPPFHKQDGYTHTHMAKAALNMLRHTAAVTLARVGIYINAVVIASVTDEDLINFLKEARSTRFLATIRCSG
jgi:NAD(P)-dependent dehydrogenase (short-subunit alcohol dehydrogenase family)